VTFLERLRALVWFLLAAAWFLFSDLVASRAAAGLTSGDFEEPLYRILLLFLLIVGYWIMSRLGQRRMDPAKATALVARPGWVGEFALGAALGWAGVLACVLPAALIGGLVITVFTNEHQFFVAVLDLIALAAGTLAIEVSLSRLSFPAARRSHGRAPRRILHGGGLRHLAHAHRADPHWRPLFWFPFSWD
jgi:hypothetical protein